MSNLIWILFIVILGPVFGTIIGILIKPSERFFCLSFSFTAGVMLAVAFFQLIPESMKELSIPIVIISFLVGFSIMFIVDQIVPHFHGVSNTPEESFERTSATITAGIAMHNLPEGFAIGASFSAMPELGLIVASAIALHDVPETIVPVSTSYSILGNRKKASFNGLAVTIPTLIGLFIGVLMLNWVTTNLIAIAMVITAGIMVYISGDELLPAAQDFGYKHLANFSLAGGISFVLLLGMI
ncbi:MAG: ZIP family metal transporter [Hadesarchaea archaeon]|nr:ZIP family metal transporter [Hadesarchaea archaeon]